MKIRIKGNSLRLRLSQTDVSQFRQRGFIQDTIVFGIETHQKLTYRLATHEGSTIEVSYDQEMITVFVPISIGNEWAQSKQVGFSTTLVIDEENVLSILVEKDFQCMQPRPGEDESDLYAHPKA